MKKIDENILHAIAALLKPYREISIDMLRDLLEVEPKPAQRASCLADCYTRK